MTMTTLAAVELAVVTGGAQGWLHPPDPDKQPSTINEYLRPKKGDWTSCAGGLWSGCPPKDDDRQ